VFEPDYSSYWEKGFTWEEYSANQIHEHEDLWHGIYRRTKCPPDALQQMAAIGRNWKLLVLAEDWCGDASNTVPVMARIAEDASNVEMRILRRDENLELMDLYLTDGGRAIPKAILLDESYDPVGVWGPRPSELQAFVKTEIALGDRERSEIYKDARRWYAKDRCDSTLRELFELFQQAAEAGA
jgi:hypothetical protein